MAPVRFQNSKFRGMGSEILFPAPPLGLFGFCVFSVSPGAQFLLVTRVDFHFRGQRPPGC
jgi:hypothetical protein